ncbi:hypothetical protein LE164_12785 (plasmid) [Staphylococcus lugdunensis]|uniref:hypothetical protein n=1 Tax=Staphylococcus lugdunensis TaxID=28035 RepID=UPI002263D837|nr:hypothetical protein [Staphylococcus lugdunensis]UZW86868.1 hypothetical protein LE164_12785 [Staphylococcus lugdunensis]
MDQLEKYAKNTLITLMFVMVFWIFMNIIFQSLLFPPPKNNLTTYEVLKYYTHIKGYYGLDHISKGITYIICSLIPLTLFYRFKNIKTTYDYRNMTGALFLLLYFLINGISLIIQGVTAEFAINIISKSNIYGSHEFAVNLFRWMIQEGGISFSTYIMCNFCFIIWLFFTCSILKEQKTSNKWTLRTISCVKIGLVPLFLLSIILIIYQIQLAQTVFVLIDFISLVGLILVFLKTSTITNIYNLD